MYDKIVWYLMAFSGVGLWVLMAYAIYETLSNPTPF